ncbi:hypothetical protein CLOM_g7209 [Closterium sp. NIES-68]|nr:hypothetical protein CLOM_g7209 [Closterium sp. NIES-68]GJP79021.1 hypothetical protein CLOP_g9272 [Closterium sp. NIES-67]
MECLRGTLASSSVQPVALQGLRSSVDSSRLSTLGLSSQLPNPLRAHYASYSRSLLNKQFPSSSIETTAVRVTAAVAAGSKVKVRFNLPIQVKFGESIAVVGSADWLGSWSDPKALDWSEAGWSVTLDAPAGQEVEFKFVIVKNGKAAVWEDGPNRKVTVPGVDPRGKEFNADVDWNKTTATLSWEVTKEDSEESFNGAPVGDSGSDSEGELSSAEDGGELEESAFAQKWAGRGVEFMRSNAHKSERRGRWDTTGLDGPAKKLVEADKGAGNWWRKLETVEQLLLPVERSQRLDAMIYASIYLQWINTGQIPCVEDGGHRRPNRHAEISRRIFRWLEKEGTRGSALSSEEIVVMRKIHPRLPAFSADFTASVPLTRIRDIAHRNDIPHNLKQEIKHTIQNKLHRNAGPEDLVATELLLRRVTRTPGEYSEAFVQQLKLFYAELKDFFNASSLTELLESIRPSLDDTGTAMLENFLACKQNVDALPSSALGIDQGAYGGAEAGSSQPQSLQGAPSGRPTDVLMSALHSLTGLRAVLLYSLESGLRNDAPDDSIAMRQKWRLSEICLEEYFFVLLSRFLNELFDEEGGDRAAEGMAGEIRMGQLGHVGVALGAAVLGLRHLGLSGWNQAECFCLENELASWQAAGIGGSTGVASEHDLRWWALRLKASLDRMRRLTEAFTEATLELFFQPSQKLGHALGIEENAVRTFAEAEIRSSVVFQLAKLTSLLLRVMRSVLGAEGWDVLVPGTAVGKLVEVERIDPDLLATLQGEEGLVLLVQRAEGDEEVKAAGANLKAVVLLQELPHLSHLAVRARQEGVLLMTCEDENRVADLRSAVGSRIRLEAGVEGVKVTTGSAAVDQHPSSSSASKAATTSGSSSSSSSGKSEDEVWLQALKPQPIRVQEARLPVLPLHEAQLATCGAKAHACAKLEGLSVASTFAGADFSVPRSAVITFGVMDEAITASNRRTLFHRLVASLDDQNLHGNSLDEACTQIRTLLEESPLPPAFFRTLSYIFPANARLIVRSSANVEDLAGMSGAGLYDSIPDVTLSDPATFGRAVASVWASLFTRRAVLSRRAAGVRQSDAAMAVLVQELISPPDLSFVLHTKGIGAGAGGALVVPSPRISSGKSSGGGSSNGNGASASASVAAVAPGSPAPADFLSAEVAPGLGETLASGTRGTAWRFAVGKSDSSVRILAFANFSEKIIMAPAAAGVSAGRNAGATSGGGGGAAVAAAGGGVVMQAVDYSGQLLSTSPDAQVVLAKKLAAVGSFLEDRFGTPQDIEGCVVGDKIFVVQSRPQP